MQEIFPSFDWLKITLEKTNIQHLLDEIDHFRIHPDVHFRLLYSALKMSFAILKEDKNALGQMLLGRLGYYDMPEIQTLLAEIPRNNVFEPYNNGWLKPADGKFLDIQVLQGHTEMVHDVLILRDRRLLSVGGDGKLCFWSANGTLLRTIFAHMGNLPELTWQKNIIDNLPN